MIFHLLTRAQWQAAQRDGIYRPPSLVTEGFIHCSTAEQVIDTANIFYRGEPDLMVLRVDEGRLTSPLVFEAPATAGDSRPGTRFPHIYGALNLDAVVEEIALPCEPDGSFRPPPAFTGSPL